MNLQTNRNSFEINLENHVKPINLWEEVLIVEDVPPERSRLEAILTKEGYNCHTARNGENALVTFSLNPIGIIICDWRMPIMNGMELLRHVKIESKSCPYFIMLSGQCAIYDTLAALNSGADDFIRKPFQVDELKARVEAGSRVIKAYETLKFSF
ncbi:response regulator transcription factor [Zooshikella ganghwensis]|uniref:response regulator transcription factor n=1 Tax=Zooshikella ganghwensis TaxID=202772 RepID=UPI000488EFE0|nr:response regulator transcription factor [Zooshikella ganghwensis]